MLNSYGFSGDCARTSTCMDIYVVSMGERGARYQRLQKEVAYQISKPSFRLVDSIEIYYSCTKELLSTTDRERVNPSEAGSHGTLKSTSTSEFLPHSHLIDFSDSWRSQFRILCRFQIHQNHSQSQLSCSLPNFQILGYIHILGLGPESKIGG